MLCQDCNQNESTVHLTQIVNNKKLVLNLCKDCAEKRGFHSPFEHMPFPLAELVTGMVGPKTAAPKSGRKSTRVKKCPGCGMTFEDFGKSGRLGCGQCYKTFHLELTDLLRKIHGSPKHRGKGMTAEPDRIRTETSKPIREETRLREELRKAIENEEFEKAANLRDQIKSLTETE
jgi:protein arginine kinase activator